MPIPITLVKASVKTDTTGARTDVPVLVTPAGVLEPLLDYFLARAHDRSLQWMLGVARAVRLFLEYLSTNPAERDNYRLFLNFGQRLYTGSYDRQSGADPSGLGWSPLSEPRARKVVTALNDFFDYLSQARPAAALFNPKYAGSTYDRMVDEAAYQYRRDKAFLGHTWATSLGTAGDAPGRLFRAKRGVQVETSEPPAFPDQHFERLITEGFRIGERYDYRNILITVLMHCAGFRESEPFHLYISDVLPDPANSKASLVLIHHPSDGDAPADWYDPQGRQRKGNRRAYLQERWGLKPRNEVLGYHHAGWKGGAHEHDLGSLYFRAYWFEPWWGEFFRAVWYRYLGEVAVHERKHPFAFVNTDREPTGHMYALAQFNKAHARAVRRIGLEVSKAAGTTPHGHRHAYGQRLREAGVPRELIRRFMHHSSLSSQEPYTMPSLASAMKELGAAAQRLESTMRPPGALSAVLES
ncbi:MAG: site-specific integrase [Burkholderiales bacterium]|nr:site-specific integrase [Burkholderiales bacterium]